MPLPGRSDALIDRSLLRHTGEMLTVLAVQLNHAGRSVPEGAWELRDLFKAAATDVPTSAVGSHLPESDGATASAERWSDLTTSQAAEEMGVSAREIQYRCEDGRLPGARKVHGRWHIPADAVRTAA